MTEEPFIPALDLVLGVLRDRRLAGARLKASESSLDALMAEEAKVPRKEVARQVEVPPSRGQAPREVRSSQGEHPRFEKVLSKPAVSELGLVRAVVSTQPKGEGLPEIVGDKVAVLAALRVEAAQCLKCEQLAQSRFSVVFGEGNPEAELMLVGEAPGEDEDMKGLPFVGAAGELLSKMLETMGLSREQVYIANVLKCRPDVPAGVPGNRKPTLEEMDRCLPFLRKQIGVIRPRVMVALGATAMQGLFGRTEPMARLRAQWHDFHGIPVMATYHPSYLLRNQALAEKRKVWEDLLQVMERLELPISARQRGFFLSKPREV